MFSINQPVFLQKTKPLHPNSKSQISIWDWDLNLNLGCKESCVCGKKGSFKKAPTSKAAKKILMLRHVIDSEQFS